MGGFGPNRPKTTMREKRNGEKSGKLSKKVPPKDNMRETTYDAILIRKPIKRDQEGITKRTSQETHKTTKKIRKSHSQRQQSHGEEKEKK